MTSGIGSQNLEFSKYLQVSLCIRERNPDLDTGWAKITRLENNCDGEFYGPCYIFYVDEHPSDPNPYKALLSHLPPSFLPFSLPSALADILPGTSALLALRMQE